jgi:hypothetical protein
VSNFLGHLRDPDEAAEFLGKTRDCINPCVRIAVTGRNFRYCAGQYFDFADHRVIMTEESTAEHLHTAGFEIKQVYARFLPYSFGGRAHAPCSCPCLPQDSIYLATAGQAVPGNRRATVSTIALSRAEDISVHLHIRTIQHTADWIALGLLVPEALAFTTLVPGFY